jgi:hypothetical protein
MMASEFVRRSTLQKTIDTLQRVYDNMEFPGAGQYPTTEQLYVIGYASGLQLAIEAFEQAIMPMEERLELKAQKHQKEFDNLISMQRGERQ